MYSGKPPVTTVPAGVIPAVDADSASLVTVVGMSVTVAGSAAGKAPMTRLTPIASLTKRPGTALALPGVLVTESSHRPV